MGIPLMTGLPKSGIPASFYGVRDVGMPTDGNPVPVLSTWIPVVLVRSHARRC